MFERHLGGGGRRCFETFSPGRARSGGRESLSLFPGA